MFDVINSQISIARNNVIILAAIYISVVALMNGVDFSMEVRVSNFPSTRQSMVLITSSTVESMPTSTESLDKQRSGCWLLVIWPSALRKRRDSRIPVVAFSLIVLFISDIPKYCQATELVSAIQWQKSFKIFLNIFIHFSDFNDLPRSFQKYILLASLLEIKYFWAKKISNQPFIYLITFWLINKFICKNVENII